MLQLKNVYMFKLHEDVKLYPYIILLFYDNSCLF